MTGLKARGNITVDITWENSKVEAQLYSDTDKTVSVRIGKEEQAEIELKAGMLYILDGELKLKNILYALPPFCAGKAVFLYLCSIVNPGKTWYPKHV